MTRTHQYPSIQSPLSKICSLYETTKKTEDQGQLDNNQVATPPRPKKQLLIIGSADKSQRQALYLELDKCTRDAGLQITSPLQSSSSAKRRIEFSPPGPSQAIPTPGLQWSFAHAQNEMQVLQQANTRLQSQLDSAQQDRNDLMRKYNVALIRINVLERQRLPPLTICKQPASTLEPSASHPEVTDTSDPDESDVSFTTCDEPDDSAQGTPPNEATLDTCSESCSEFSVTEAVTPSDTLRDLQRRMASLENELTARKEHIDELETRYTRLSTITKDIRDAASMQRLTAQRDPQPRPSSYASVVGRSPPQQAPLPSRPPQRPMEPCPITRLYLRLQFHTRPDLPKSDWVKAYQLHMERKLVELDIADDVISFSRLGTYAVELLVRQDTKERIELILQNHLCLVPDPKIYDRFKGPGQQEACKARLQYVIRQLRRIHPSLTESFFRDISAVSRDRGFLEWLRSQTIIYRPSQRPHNSAQYSPQNRTVPAHLAPPTVAVILPSPTSCQ